MRHPSSYRATRIQRLIAALALGGLLAFGSPADADLLGAATSEGHHLSATVYRQGAALLIDGPGGAVSQEVDEEWDVRVSPGGALIGLLRDSRTGTQLRLLDATGSPVSERFFPIEEKATVTDRGVVTLAYSADQMLGSHSLKFYASSGELIAEVEEPELSLFSSQVLPGGMILTENGFPGMGATTFIAYGSDGRRLWRHVVAAAGTERVICATASPDGERLIYVQAAKRGTQIHFVDPAGRVLARHPFSHIDQLVVSDDSSLVAAVGARSLALFDAATGELIWHVRAPFGAPAMDGLRFSELGDELFVLTSQIDAAGETGRAHFHRARLTDGQLTSRFLGEHSTHEGLMLLGVLRDGAGGLRLVLPRREVSIAGPAGPGVAP
jgi:hypothetical protein